jgi:hypothetical protein
MVAKRRAGAKESIALWVALLGFLTTSVTFADNLIPDATTDSPEEEYFVQLTFDQFCHFVALQAEWGALSEREMLELIRTDEGKWDAVVRDSRRSLARTRIRSFSPSGESLLTQDQEDLLAESTSKLVRPDIPQTKELVQKSLEHDRLPAAQSSAPKPTFPWLTTGTGILFVLSLVYWYFERRKRHLE